ncbi:MAG: hypothetical protein HYZ90_05280 [Candidatus Omnitrophica bacterium]|nr:hypothetical protein [Candidatus Omnitrophota bacterium]
MNSSQRQIEAARTRAALVGGLRRGILAVRGKDRVSFLHNILTHDIKGLQTGQGKAACLLDRQGKIRFFCLVHALAGELLMEMEPSALAIAQEELNRYRISEEVQWEELAGGLRTILLLGPASVQILQTLFKELSLPTAPLSHTEGPPDSDLLRVVRRDELLVPGFQLWTAPESEEGLQTTLLREGEKVGLEKGGEELLEILRIEAGIPRPGRELIPSVILNELEREDFWSASKGCFVGQEILVRIKHRAHPPRLLRGFLLEGNSPPPCPAELFLGADPVGTLTSALFSPTLNRTIALGFLKYGVEAPRVEAETPGGRVAVEVVKLPFGASGRP